MTLIRGREPDEALTILGAAPGSIGPAAFEDVPFGVTDRELVLAREWPERGWTFAVECDGPSGFLGWRRDLLAGLSARGGFAGTALYLPNVQEVCAAEDGQVVSVVEPLRAYRRSGTHPDRFAVRMRELGFGVGDEDDRTGVARDLPPGALTTLLLEVMTGVTLDASALEGPWLGGMMRFDERGAQIRFPSH
ncbi:DUF6461 domain-containing protein [Amycolatopsis sp. FU40]|uniref:DUF6461 domain-containing protein n=1 Tax=Amycolatopsis sp. FU40 TaxID=2914159 RepID=UPI001F1F9D3C|nr:DUF6461 domain-containing protein [Amycolatopsis sp. FU40]UKD57758.1 DUF6461 domain-containing protein [Amycolatopsis sp. FU40]